MFNVNGLLIIDKPKTWTSFDVVKKVRGMLRSKSRQGGMSQTPKVGHTGTLDPMATGVLILCIGQATKQVSKIMGMEKEYVGEITLGATSTTDDADGVITPCRSDPALAGEEPPRLQEIQQALSSFVGTFDQLPPKHSAKKIEGKRAYHLARQGKEFELKPVPVTAHEIELLDYRWPSLKLRVRCGKGFYMRSLARDLGEKLGVGGYLSELIRTCVGKYSLDQTISIEQVDASRVLTSF